MCAGTAEQPVAAEQPESEEPQEQDGM